MIDPIIILMTGRSGSSMVAGIFAEHDVWVGKCTEDHYVHGTYENREIKRIVQETCGRDFLAPVQHWPSIREDVQKVLIQEQYTHGPWLFKQGAQYHTVWADMSPSFIFIRRPIADILASYERSGWLDFYDEKKRLQFIEQNNAIMDSLDGIDVFIDEVVRGDYSSLEKAFDYCDIPFDEKIADAFIDPNKWNQDA